MITAEPLDLAGDWWALTRHPGITMRPPVAAAAAAAAALTTGAAAGWLTLTDDAVDTITAPPGDPLAAAVATWCPRTTLPDALEALTDPDAAAAIEAATAARIHARPVVAAADAVARLYQAAAAPPATTLTGRAGTATAHWQALAAIAVAAGVAGRLAPARLLAVHAMAGLCRPAAAAVAAALTAVRRAIPAT